MLIFTCHHIQQKQSYPRLSSFISSFTVLSLLLLPACHTQVTIEDFFDYKDAEQLTSNYKEFDPSETLKYPHWSDPENTLIAVSLVS